MKSINILLVIVLALGAFAPLGTARAEGNGLNLNLGAGVIVDAPGINLKSNGQVNAWGQLKKALTDEDRQDRDDDNDADKKRERTVVGTITAIAGSSITIKMGSGSDKTYTVDASEAKLTRRFGGAIEIGQIQVNDRLQVRGTIEGNVIAASAIRDLSVQMKRAQFRGTVLSISTTTTSFVLKIKERANQTVMVSAETAIKSDGSAAVFADLSAGQTVTVTGVWNSTNNTIAAKTVNIVMEWRPIFVRGTVTAKTDTTLTVRGHSGTVYTVDITRALFVSRFFAPGALLNVAVNDTVTVGGIHLNDSANISAFIVRDLTSTTTTP